MCLLRRLALKTSQIVLFLGAINLVVCVTDESLHVQGMFPLSGKQASRGYAELAGARYALKVAKNPTELQFAHNDSECDAKTEAKLTLDAIAKEGTNIMLLGGGCQASETYNDGRVLPQIIFESTYVTSSSLVINLRPTLASLHHSLAALISYQGWKNVTIVYQQGHIYQEGSAILSNLLKSKGITTGLYLKNTNKNTEAILKDSTLRIIILYLSPSKAREFLCQINDKDGRYRWILPTVNSTDISKACPANNATVLTLHLKQVVIKRDFTRKIEQTYDIHGEDIVSAAFSNDALTLAIKSLNSTSNNEVFAEMKSMTLDGATGSVQFWPNGQRLFQTRIKAYIGDQMFSYGSFFSSLTRYTDKKVIAALNVPDSVEKVVEIENVGLAFFIIMTSLAIIIIIYAIAIIGYIIKMREERFYKMTSPNINIVILLSAVLGCVYVILIGMSGVKSSPRIIRDVHVASRYLLSIAFSLFYGSVLMKTWRVYVIFRNLNANGKLTRDIVLVSVIFAMVIVDVILVSIWSFADPLKCDIYNSSIKYEAAAGIDRVYQAHICWSDLQPVWVSLTYLYKAAILATCLYFAWQTRHVTLPSMQDAPFIYVVILNGAFVGVLLIPNLVLYPLDGRFSYSVTSLAMLYLAIANISLLFIPKMVTYRQIQKGLKKDDKLAFSVSLKKTQEATEKSGCLNKCFGSAEKDKAAWQEVLSVEIENLKAAVKQKDATIRELTDRLYYGAEKFQEYLTRRQPPVGSSNHGGESRAGTASNTPQLGGTRRPSHSQSDTGYVTPFSEYARDSNPRHSQAYSDSGRYFIDNHRRGYTGDAGQSNRRHSHNYNGYGKQNGAFRSRNDSKTGRIGVEIHNNSVDSSSSGDEDSIIPTPRMVMAPPIEKRSNIQTMANVANVRSLEDISHDSAIENPPDSSDKDSDQVNNNRYHQRMCSTPAQPNILTNRPPPFSKNPEGTPGSDDSGIAAIYSPVNLPSIYSPLEYNKPRNYPSARYEKSLQVDTIV